MKIESGLSLRTTESGGRAAVESLESHIRAANRSVPENKRPDPEFERLYELLSAMEGQGEKVIHAFLRSRRGADGESPAYPTAKALMAVTQQVLFRLKDDGLEKSLLYKEIEGANGLAFSMDLFVKSLMRDVFQPMEDEAWEKSEW
ncbi:hypothetical protein [Pseudomonas sp. G5(2012)]|uniref:hypothetical protein n=1 Tax=Pseudomonas sp. G5(2012) TaxID=1268068 RepID=UPI0003431D1F|nr:hypothetical protein [Pseudomonas sp. G5(2012)]EPA98557.1 hypothetical protein PG5_09130 [Pseudomonas sp. G5(2012)]